MIEQSRRQLESRHLLDDLIQQFSSLHVDHKNRNRALSTLRWIKNNNIPNVDPAGQIESITQNDSICSHLINEVQNSPRNSFLRFREVMTGIKEGTKEQFIRVFQTFESNPQSDPYVPQNRPISLLDFPLSSNGNLRSLISIPSQFRNEYVFKTSYDNSPLCSITATPAGNISEPHMDRTGAGSILIEIIGTKLFLIWPPTTHNLEWFKNKYGIVSSTFLEAS